MPAANQFRLPALRISSTGVLQDAGGQGVSTSWILKSPFASRGTGFVSRSTNGATFSQMSVAKTLRVAVPPVDVTTTAVPTVLPPANTRPRPSASMRPSAFTSALESAIVHSWPAGCTVRTILRLTVAATGAGPGALETLSTPIPPLNLTSESSVRPSDGTSAIRPIARSVTVLMAQPPRGSWLVRPPSAAATGSWSTSDVAPNSTGQAGQGIAPASNFSTSFWKPHGTAPPVLRGRALAGAAPLRLRALVAMPRRERSDGRARRNRNSDRGPPRPCRVAATRVPNTAKREASLFAVGESLDHWRLAVPSALAPHASAWARRPVEIGRGGVPPNFFRRVAVVSFCLIGGGSEYSTACF